MSEIKILHLYSRLLSLYGEYGNVAVLAKILTDKGHTVTVDCLETLPEDLRGCSLVYTGAGTEQDVVAAAQRIKGESVADYLANGGLWLATGNSMALLGQKIQWGDTAVEGLGLADFKTEMVAQKRWLGDALTTADNPFGAPIIGYINTSSVYSGVDSSLFTLALGKDLGNDKQGAADGYTQGGIIATQLTGPLLVKNPAVLAYVYERLTGQTLQIDDTDPMALAYSNAYKQLAARLG